MNVEILNIYRKLKMLNFVKMKLVEQIHANYGDKEEQNTIELDKSHHLRKQTTVTFNEAQEAIKQKFSSFDKIQSQFKDRILNIISKSYAYAQD
jgi:hypothetical protein